MNPLSIFTGPYGMLAKWGVIAVLALAFFTTGWVKGNQHGTEKLIKYKGEQAIAKVEVLTKIEKVKGDTIVKWKQGETKIVTQYQIIEKENTNVPSRPECNVTAGWMRGHDNAASGASERNGGSLDDKTDTGIREAAALGVVTRNYKAYHQVANDLQSCRSFVDGLAKVTK